MFFGTNTLRRVNMAVILYFSDSNVIKRPLLNRDYPALLQELRTGECLFARVTNGEETGFFLYIGNPADFNTLRNQGTGLVPDCVAIRQAEARRAYVRHQQRTITR